MYCIGPWDLFGVVAQATISPIQDALPPAPPTRPPPPKKKGSPSLIFTSDIHAGAGEREREKEKNKQNTAYKHMKSRLPRISISNVFLSDEAKGVAVVASNSPDTSEKLHPNAWKLVMFVQLRRG